MCILFIYINHQCYSFIVLFVLQFEPCLVISDIWNINENKTLNQEHECLVVEKYVIVT